MTKEARLLLHTSIELMVRPSYIPSSKGNILKTCHALIKDRTRVEIKGWYCNKSIILLSDNPVTNR